MNATKLFSGLILFSIFTLNAGVTVEEKERLGEALISAARYGNCKDVKEVLNLGADINFREIEQNVTALHWAVYRGKLEMTKLLADLGANVNLQDVEGNTPLILVVQQHEIKEEVCLKIMEVLLNAKGIKVNYKNKLSETALLWAALKERAKECKLLLKHGANVNIADKDWDYPVDVVSYNKKLKQKLQPTWLYRFVHWLKE